MFAFVKEEIEMSSQHASFRVVAETEESVTLQDVGPWTVHATVTNDAEWVVEHLPVALRGRRLFYYDSDGEKDELLVKDGKFAGFGMTQR